MNDQQAKDEAISRWGALGTAWHGSRTAEYGRWYCCVGWIADEPGGSQHLAGHGETWEQAFEMAGKANGSG